MSAAAPSAATAARSTSQGSLATSGRSEEPPPVKLIRSFLKGVAERTAIAQEHKETTDAAAVRALRGSLQDVHRALAEKEEALQRLATIHAKLLNNHSELERKLKEQPPPEPAPAAVPPAAAPDDSPSWVTPRFDHQVTATSSSSSCSSGSGSRGCAPITEALSSGGGGGGGGDESEHVDKENVVATPIPTRALARKDSFSRALLRANATNSALERELAQLRADLEEAKQRAEGAEQRLVAERAVTAEREAASALPSVAVAEIDGESPAKDLVRALAADDAYAGGGEGGAELSLCPAASSSSLALVTPACERKMSSELASRSRLISPTELLTAGSSPDVASRILLHHTGSDASAMIREAEARYAEQAAAAERAAASASAELEAARAMLAESEARREHEVAQLTAALEQSAASSARLLAEQRQQQHEQQQAEAGEDDDLQRLAERLRLSERALEEAQSQRDAALARAAASESAAYEAQREAEALRDAEEMSKRKLAAEMWEMRSSHQAALERNREALELERARSRELRAELEASGKREAVAAQSLWLARQQAADVQQPTVGKQAVPAAAAAVPHPRSPMRSPRPSTELEAVDKHEAVAVQSLWLAKQQQQHASDERASPADVSVVVLRPGETSVVDRTVEDLVH